ncbi:MAG: hypothetical protein ABW221_14120 [Vicinamibacteria bacterium]
MKTRFAVSLAAAALLLGGTIAIAEDPWEGGIRPDDTVLTRNTLSPGLVQQHTLDEAPSYVNDVDWMRVPTLSGHSYEARVSGSGVTFDWGDCASCPQFERVSITGAILTEDVGVVTDGAGPGSVWHANDRSVRWIAEADNTADLVRVRGDELVPEHNFAVYTIRYWDTTYTVPRWNTSNGQATVLVITSTVPKVQQARLHFYGGSGALLASQDLLLQENVPSVLNLATIPALAEQSGFALVAHTSGYGGLTGKAVSLEPATGFTFDTPIQSIPQ